MLLSLKISNIALIEDIEIQFKKGLNILSGETGAGKSIILDSIALISGELARTDFIRTGKEEAKILAIFDLEGNQELKIYLETLGINTSENLLIIERQIFKDKRPSLAFVNHSRILVNVLKDIGKNLLDIHSQHENQALFDAHKHLEILDHYQGLDQAIQEYHQNFQEAIQLKKKVQELEQQKKDNEEKESYYHYQLEELEEAHINLQEWEQLEESLAKLESAVETSQELQKLYAILYDQEDFSVISQIQEVAYSLEKPIFDQKENHNIREYLQEALVKIQEVLDFIRDKKSTVDISPEEIEEKQKRYDFLRDLQRKYRKNIGELLEYQQELKELLSVNDKIEDQIQTIEKERETLKQKLIQKALQLSHERHKGAKALEVLIQKELIDLHMFNTEFEIRFQTLQDPQGIVSLPDGKQVRLLKDGIEKAEFFVSFNKGEEKRPLTKVGSGGEIARLMLALKKILHQVAPVATQIFDEIDTGIGGETAFAVGTKLLEISKSRQVICITHLPQIAAMGELQYLVKKITQDGRTQTTIVPLTEEERIMEISRMLSGDSLSPVSLEHAKELIQYKETKTLEFIKKIY